MNDLKIEIVRLEPMLVASTYGYGDSPEDEAWKKMAAWAGPLGFFENLKDNPLFGYNNPPPLDGNKQYGYELFIKVDKGTPPAEGVRIYLFYGGPFVITRCDCRGGHFEDIPATWKRLERWCKQNGYAHAYRPGLERVVAGHDDHNELILDLYFPI